jgi:flagellar hook-length control protein FliK
MDHAVGIAVAHTGLQEKLHVPGGRCMSILMNPVLPVPGPEISVKKAGGARDFENSFARNLDRQLDEKYDGNSDKLGVAQNNAKSDQKYDGNSDKLGVAQNNEKSQESLQAKDNSAYDAKSKSDKRNASGDDKVSSVVELLSQFLAELREVAEKKTGVPGEWKAELPDMELLQQLAADAGMKEADFSQFMQQLKNQDNKIGLVDFFEALTRYFQEMDESVPITVSEAELPMLEALLAKMGIAEESIARIADKAVTGDGKLDLSLLVKGLDGAAEVEGLVPVTLTDWEAEQLQNLLAEAGLTLEAQNELLPERFLNQVLGLENAGEQVQLSIERLQTMLNDAIAVVRESQPKVDLPAFLSDLQKIISQSDFESQGAGWTPVVEKSVTAVFQKLQELVDMARIKVEGNKLGKNQLIEDQDFNDDFAKWVKGLDEKFDQSAAQDDTADFSGGTASGQQSGEEVTAAKSESASPPATTFTVKSGGQEVVPAPDAGKGEAAARTPSRQLQQQVVQQLSDGVVRGLKSQEHHLVLRLFPQDLGEVKVNLTVMDEHVFVSFNMENARVKEMLESNMQEFKESMNQRGFSLGECSVSVGQQGNGESWQRFEMARQAVKAARETMADLPADALYLQAAAPRMDGRQNGINLIV